MCRRSQLLVLVAINSCFALLAMRADAAPLIANWKLDEPTTMQPVLESVGTPGIGNGTYSAGVVVGVPGPFPQFGTAASFNGSSWADVGGGSVLNMTNNFTVSAWVNFDSLPGGVKRTYLSNANGWGVRSSGTAPQITTFGVKDYDGLPGTLTAGTWHHVVTVLDSNFDATFYVDGVFAGTSLHNLPANGNNGPYAIGTRGPGGGEQMVGDVDDVGVFSRALTADEIATIYNLAVEDGLHYQLGEANTLLDAFTDGLDEVVIGNRTWFATTGLGGSNGDVFALENGYFSVNIADGAGFTTFVAPVPEPATLSLAVVAAIVALGAGRRLRARRS